MTASLNRVSQMSTHDVSSSNGVFCAVNERYCFLTVSVLFARENAKVRNAVRTDFFRSSLLRKKKNRHSLLSFLQRSITWAATTDLPWPGAPVNRMSECSLSSPRNHCSICCPFLSESSTTHPHVPGSQCS